MKKKEKVWNPNTEKGWRMEEEVLGRRHPKKDQKGKDTMIDVLEPYNLGTSNFV